MAKFPKSVVMEVFKGGNQTDSAGIKNEWTESKLDKIVDGYNKIGDEVPACVSKDGHPVNNQPAFGWFSEFTRKGNSIFAKLSNINNDFAQMLRDKTFKNRSIALRNDLSPRHVAFLGSMAPAIKGLENYAFSEGEEFSEFNFAMGENEFADFQTTNGFNLIGRILQRMRDFKIEEKDVETADKIINQFEVDRLKNMEPTPEPSFNEPPLNQPKTEDNNMDFQEKFEAEKAKNEKLSTELEGVKSESKTFSESAVSEKKRADDLQAKFDKQESDTKAKEFNEFAESLVSSGKILPAEKESVILTMDSLSGLESFDFTESDGKVIKKTRLDVYKKTLEGKPVGNLFNEKFVNGNSGPASKDESIRLETNKLMEAEKLSFNEAGRKLMATKPELFKGLEFTENTDEQK